jgi:hypothetical protein
VDRTAALDRISKVARTGYDVGRTVAGQAGKAAVGVSKAAAAVGRDVLERRRSRITVAPRVPAPRTPSPATSDTVAPPAAPAAESDAAVTSDVDATVVAAEPSPADVARVVAKKPRPKTPTTAAAKKKASKKSVPGAKLPPRKPSAGASAEDADKG